jgi:hypothetical protein
MAVRLDFIGAILVFFVSSLNRHNFLSFTHVSFVTDCSLRRVWCLWNQSV